MEIQTQRGIDVFIEKQKGGYKDSEKDKQREKDRDKKE